MSYILSIVIPTKDRYEYLRETIKTLVDMDRNDIEIVIQDNTYENNDILEYINNLGKDNLKYYHVKEPLPVSDNCDLAVGHASGDYICFIGDDDSVAKEIIDVAYLMKKYSIDACNCLMAQYHWSDVKFKYLKKPYLSFSRKKVKVKRLDTNKTLIKYLRNGMQEIRFLPRAYHGIISKGILDKIKMTTGYYFPGPSPDMANAVAASSLIQSHYFFRMPLIVSGSSYKSTAGMGLRGKHKGSLSSVKHLPKNIDETWDKRIPKIWLAHTIWPESAIKALNAMGRRDYENYMNWYAMFARILLRDPQSYIFIKPHMLNIKYYFFTLIEMIKALVIWMFRKGVIYFNRLFKIEYMTTKPLSIIQACNLVNYYNSKHNNLFIIEKKLQKYYNK
mgnify:CR=1 FL=1